MRLSDITADDLEHVKTAEAAPAVSDSGEIEVELPDGGRGFIAPDMQERALADGLRIISAEEKAREAALEDADDSNLQAGALGALRGVTAGLSDQIIEKSGLVSRQRLSDLQEANPYISGGAEIAGTIAPVLFSGGTSLGARALAATPAALIEAAGAKAATKLTGKFLSQTTSNVIKKAISTGVGSAVEGSLYGVGKVISEDALGNAEFNAENVLASASQGAILGGALGGTASLIGSGAGRAMGAAKSKVRDLKRSFIKKANLDEVTEKGIISKIVNEEKVDDYLEAVGANKEDLRNAIGEELDFDNTELLGSAERLGVPLTEGMKTGGLYRELEGSLSKSKSIFGNWTAKKVQNTYDGLEVVKDQMLKQASDIDPVAIGVQAKQGMRASIENELEPAKLLYQELKPIMEATPITESLKKRFVTTQGKDYLNRVAGDGESWLKKMSRVETIDDVTKLRSSVRSDMVGATGTLKHYLSGLYDNLTTLRQNAITYNLKGKPFKSKAGQIQDTSEALKLADTMYRETHTKYDFLKKQFGIKSENMDNFLDKFDEVTDKQVADKILSLRDPEAAKKFQEFFPEVYEMARAKRLSEIAKKSEFEGKFSPKKFFSNVESLGETDLSILFPNIKNPKQVIKDFGTVTQNLPPLTNPSGTAYEQALQGMLSIPYQAQEGARYLLLHGGGEKFKARMRGFIDDVDHIEMSGVAQGTQLDQAVPVLNQIEKASNKGKVSISDAVDSFFNKAKKAGTITGRAGLKYLTGMDVSKEKEKEVEEKVGMYSQDPSAIVDNFVKNNTEMLKAAPKTAQALQQRILTGATFLNSKIPKQDDSPFKDSPKSRSEMLKFKNYVEAVEQPYKTLENLKHGYFSPEAMEAMQVVYPQMFSAIREEMSQRLPEFKKLSEKQKGEISKILNLGAKKAFSPQGFATLQTISAGGVKENMQQQAAPSAAGARNIQSSGRAQTGLDKVLAR